MGDKKHVTGRPLQRISWAEKNANKQQFFKDTIEYYISQSTFNNTQHLNSRTKDMEMLYGVYNGKFPKEWFSHVTDPLNARNPQHKQWPGKVRPANILSPNINLMHGEYPGRPFSMQVAIKGDQGYSSFQEAKKKELFSNLSQMFINTVNEASAQQEGALNTGVESKQADVPEQLMAKFVNSYRSLLAEQAQTDLDLIMEDQHVKEKLLDSFKHWLIVGETYSYKDIIRDKTVYESVSPLEIDYDKSPHVKYIKDGEWVTRRTMNTISDVVDRFYDSLKPENIDSLEGGNYTASPTHFLDRLSTSYGESGKVPVYHVVWKSLKKIKVITFSDPVTGEEQMDEVEEDYKIDKELGETEKIYWVTQVLEGYRIGADIYVEMKVCNYQVNQISNFGKDELPYNGRCFSDTHTENTSVLKIGLPFQVMFCITFFTLEKTIAKSGGKILLLDNAVVPTQEGWDEEKFFWYSEAKGYMLLNRNQIGVDKSITQYQVVDMSMFQHIAELIKLLEYYKSAYDQQLGISPQRKAEIKSTDTATGVQASLEQSSVITEMVFASFDQFVRADLEGLLACSQISNRHGKRAIYTNSDLRTKLLEINPDEYCYAEMGIFLTDSKKEAGALARIRGYAQALAQNGQDIEAIISIETSNNIATLKNILKELQDKQLKMSQASAESEHQKEVEKIQIEQDYKQFLSLLATQKMHEEYDRKEDLVLTQGDINMAIEAGVASLQGGDTSGTEALMAYQAQRDKTVEDSRLKEMDIDRKVEEGKRKHKLDEKKTALEHNRKLRAQAEKEKIDRAKLTIQRRTKSK